jgi:hypothetical protein
VSIADAIDARPVGEIYSHIVGSATEGSPDRSVHVVGTDLEDSTALDQPGVGLSDKQQEPLLFKMTHGTDRA